MKYEDIDSSFIISKEANIKFITFEQIKIEYLLKKLIY